MGNLEAKPMIVQVSADLTGTVWKIMVNIGDQVAEGDALAIMESMKMEIPVMAPEAGEVVEIPVQEGDVVQEGTPVVRLKV